VLTYQRLECLLSSSVQQFSGTYDEAMAPLHLPLAKLEADEHCTGEAKFTADLPMPQSAQSVNGGLFGAYTCGARWRQARCCAWTVRRPCACWVWRAWSQRTT